MSKMSRYLKDYKFKVKYDNNLYIILLLLWEIIINKFRKLSNTIIKNTTM